MYKKYLQPAFFFFIFILSGLLLKNFVHIKYLNKQNQDIVFNSQNTKKENVRLSKEIDLLENNPTYILLVARQKLGMIKENEIVYKFIRNMK
tara:strand:+ start:1090 stop:1365 length:276 start_codon:yes stop_codon:yes gene_type:complete